MEVYNRWLACHFWCAIFVIVLGVDGQDVSQRQARLRSHSGLATETRLKNLRSDTHSTKIIYIRKCVH